uniref:Uncharacterized protein n=1 Tax=Lates calcarifer TaxID=8187 RepID=A0A4W6C5L3_LATCA
MLHIVRNWPEQLRNQIHNLWSQTKINVFGSDGGQMGGVLTVRHGGWSMLIWGCMSVKGGRGVKLFKFVCRGGIFQHDGTKVKTMTWPSMLPDLNPIKKTPAKTCLCIHSNTDRHTTY